MNPAVTIQSDLCTGCGLCVQDCTFKHLTLRDGKAAPVPTTHCSECGHCFAICPQGAVQMAGTSDSGILAVDSVDRIAPDTLLDNLKIRRSIRCFRPDPVDREDIRRIIEAGRFTPTGSNRQQNRYLVVENPTETIEPDGLKAFQELLDREKASGNNALAQRFSYLELTPGSFFHYAPAVILVISTDPVDAALASTSMELMAEAMGYGVLYVGLYTRAVKHSSELRRDLGIREGEDLVTVLAVGKTDLRYQRSVPRKPADITWAGDRQTE